MSHWIQIKPTGIYFFSTVSEVSGINLNCPYDCEQTSIEVLEEWARERAKKLGNCDVCDQHGTVLLSEDDPDIIHLRDPAYRFSGYLGHN